MYTHYTILYYTILYYTILYYTILLGEVPPKRGRHSTICVLPPNASVQWQPDGLAVRTNKLLLGAGFLGAPPISLTLSFSSLHVVYDTMSYYSMLHVDR